MDSVVIPIQESVFDFVLVVAGSKFRLVTLVFFSILIVANDDQVRVTNVGNVQVFSKKISQPCIFNYIDFISPIIRNSLFTKLD